MKVGDIVFIKKGAYGSIWDGWPMIIEEINEKGIGLRYQNKSTNPIHEHIFYINKEISKYLEVE